MRIKLVFLILFSALCINSITAQDNNKKITITGVVLDSDKEPIVDAIVMIDGKKTRTITDTEGKYKIRVLPTSTKIGIFTFGYGICEEDIFGRTKINFNFESVPSLKLDNRNAGITLSGRRKVPSGEESVDVGYGHLKKKDLTIDISFIDGTDKKYATYHSVLEMIIREVSGVRQVGNGIIIQDAGNLFGAVSPLIIIDGLEGLTLDDVQPIDVASISVLKGTAAAIYGSRGYGGAVIIKTKSYDEY
jgi:TonB-dependent SusC/RagA subfamily outer membrane receptor